MNVLHCTVTLYLFAYTADINVSFLNESASNKFSILVHTCFVLFFFFKLMHLVHQLNLNSSFSVTEKKKMPSWTMCLCKHVLLFLRLSENNPKNFFFLFKEKHSYQNLIYYTLEKKIWLIIWLKEEMNKIDEHTDQYIYWWNIWTKVRYFVFIFFLLDLARHLLF